MLTWAPEEILKGREKKMPKLPPGVGGVRFPSKESRDAFLKRNPNHQRAKRDGVFHTVILRKKKTNV